MGRFYHEMGMYYCSQDRRHPGGSQHFSLGQYKEIVYYGDAAYCIEPVHGTLQLHACQRRQQNQYFRYDLDTQQLKHRKDEKKCLEVSTDGNKVGIADCDSNEQRQKWKWGHVDEEKLRNWENEGVTLE